MADHLMNMLTQTWKKKYKQLLTSAGRISGIFAEMKRLKNLYHRLLTQELEVGESLGYLFHQRSPIIMPKGKF